MEYTRALGALLRTSWPFSAGVQRRELLNTNNRTFKRIRKAKIPKKSAIWKQVV
jgi:hypothetical protein